MRSFAAASKTTSRIAWSKAFAESWMAKCSYTLTAWWQEKRNGLKLG